jgi:hypothetical protein
MAVFHVDVQRYTTKGRCLDFRWYVPGFQLKIQSGLTAGRQLYYREFPDRQSTWPQLECLPVSDMGTIWVCMSINTKIVSLPILCKCPRSTSLALVACDLFELAFWQLGNEQWKAATRWCLIRKCHSHVPEQGSSCHT